MDDIVKDFLIESRENLDRLDQELVQLEADPQSKELLASIFRTIHTIKGSCGFLGFARLEKVAHAGESLLSRLREGELVLTAELTSGLLAMVDAVRRMLSEIQATEHDGQDEYPELIETLRQLQAGGGVGAQKSETSPEQGVKGMAEAGKPPAPTMKETAIANAAPASGGPEEDPAYAPEFGKIGGVLVSRGEIRPEELAAALHDQERIADRRPTPGKIGALLVERGQVRPEDLAVALQEQERGDQRRVGEILVALGLCKPEDIASALQTAHAREREADVETVRVGVNLLDKLMNLVGELVLARNQLLQFSSGNQDSGFQAISQRMNHIASELQEDVMKTRMQPIANVWNKFPRTVRDLALSCGKKVRLEMEGQETELDRTILEAVKDPLTHLVRNSVDHGIETPEARLKAGKPESGCLRLRAFHESGQVNIEITDDGAGLSLERIRAKAIERGLITAQQATHMPEREMFNLIFLPGFSTAEKVTKVSGRGVGMDVVRTNLEKIGGTADLRSVAGKGTTVSIKIPLTMAIVPALVVRSSGERFAIPQMSLTELVRLDSDHSIEKVQGAPVYRLRGQLLPLVYLNEVLHPQASAGADTPPATSRRELMDFAASREKHQQWVVRLQDLLDGKIVLTINEASSPRDCALGKWLYGPGLREYGHMPEMRSLEETHRHFHELVREVIVAKVNGFETKARSAFAGVAPLTGQIVDLLNAVESRRAIDLDSVNIVVLQAASQQFGLVVDDILDSVEIVVKPLGKQLKGIGVYAGATIMGDGSVALILDVMGVAQRSSVISEVHEHALAEKGAAVQSLSAEKRRFLLFAGPGGSRMAMPLDTLARLEELSSASVEKAGSQWVTQYRGEILPLVNLEFALAERRRHRQEAKFLANESSTSLSVLVCHHQGRVVGLVVEQILDIVEDAAELKYPASRPGVLYSTVINERVTELIDVPAILNAAGLDTPAQPATIAKAAEAAN